MKGIEFVEIFQEKPIYNQLTFERVEIPFKKKAKFKFLQLLNPGFDSRIKVYYKYTEQGTDLTKKYFIIKDDGQLLDIKEKDYEGLFNTLYGDCAEMMALFPNGGLNYQNISTHVYTYD